MQESRLFRIVYYLLDKGKATAPELAEKFEVSIRTIYRDIDAISSAGIPIYAIQGKGGGISILGESVFNKSLLSYQEQERILMALQGLNAADDENTGYLLSKLGGLFKVEPPNWIEVDFSNWIKSSPRQDIFNLIKDAVFRKNVISFQYYNAKGSCSDRSVEPLKLVFKSKDWYLYGFCQMRNDFRFFKLSRIRNLEIKEAVFTRIAPQKLLMNEAIEKEKTLIVKLKFDNEMAFRVFDEFFEDNIKYDNGYLYVQTSLPDNDDILYNYLLSFSDHVEVIEPVSVREKIKNKIKDMYDKYIT